LQFSVDWYDIDMSGAIGQIGVQGILNECTAGNAAFCANVIRDPVTNAVVGVRNPYLNINNAAVRGIDYELLWSKEPNLAKNQAEQFTLRFLAGRLLEDSTTTPTGAVTDYSGQLGEPDFRGLISLNYQVGKFGATLQERYLAESGINPAAGPVQFIQFQPGLVPAPGQLTIDDATVDSKAYTDLTLYYNGDLQNGKQWQLALAITNLTDSDPPIIPVFDQRFSSQSNPLGFNAYDVYGRRYMLNFTYKL
jgi:hypothetical protein